MRVWPTTGTGVAEAECEDLPVRWALLAALLLAAGCGGMSTPAYESVQPCLAGEGPIIDHGRTPNLPFLSPYDPNLGRMPSPEPFQRDVELSFRAPGPGANDVRLFFFDGEDAALRSYDRIRKHSLRRFQFMRRGIAYVPGAVLQQGGAVLFLWSSTPSASQQTAVTGCLG
jgi:hypothetical protein